MPFLPDEFEDELTNDKNYLALEEYKKGIIYIARLQEFLWV
jgi:hypothetical protein